MNVAVLGATGAVGRTMLEVLAARDFSVDRLALLASERSAGSTIEWKGREVEVRAPARGCFAGIDIALFSAGGERSRLWATRAAEEGAVVIDNSSAWRMDSQVPLVVPEVNPEAARERPRGIIANPNCSTIQVVVALDPIRRVAGIRSLILTTFQAVSGAGEKGRAALRAERDGSGQIDSPFTRQIDGNVVPQIGPFDSAGWSEEEMKMIHEPRKIFSMPRLQVAPTCVRVPVQVGHAVQLAVETEREMDREQARDALSGAPGVVFLDDADRFPTPVEIAGRDEVFVGRLRADRANRRILHLWVVADNLRKGAATNAVQIAEQIRDG